MAILRAGPDDPLVTLAAHTLVGRSSVCVFRLHEPKVSAEHARIMWRDERWHVRDLGSRNSTFINGTRLEHGGSGFLAQGDTVAFGDADRCFTLIDDGPPVAVARVLPDDRFIHGRHDMLVLPDEEAPEFCVFENDDGAWMVEHAGSARTVQSGEIVQVAGRSYMLHLPVTVAPTVTEDRSPGVEDIELRFEVSRDEEQVQVFVRAGDQVHEIPPRSHHYTLLTLARLRERDRQEPDRPEIACGWTSVDELCRMLAADETRLNVEIYRLRREVAAIGVRNAAKLIERRRGTRLLRLGAGRLAIARH